MQPISHCTSLTTLCRSPSLGVGNGSGDIQDGSTVQPVEEPWAVEVWIDAHTNTKTKMQKGFAIIFREESNDISLKLSFKSFTNWQWCNYKAISFVWILCSLASLWVRLIPSTLCIYTTTTHSLTGRCSCMVYNWHIVEPMGIELYRAVYRMYQTVIINYADQG